ncbi:MAG: hypothetical protein ISS82_06320 [Nanoarchaeota archaeon]|nr:hypothetical protein [Nanoarchaeota archaeon]
MDKGCFGGKGGFPTFWAIVLVLAAVWFVQDMGWLNINFPWLAAILVVVALGAIINHGCCEGKKKKK